MKIDNFDWLQKWYLANVNGDWEHRYGIKISTLDNPGWSVDIDLTETFLSGRSFSSIEIEKNNDDWVFCKIEDQKFKIDCGPLNLNQGLAIFREWTESCS